MKHLLILICTVLTVGSCFAEATASKPSSVDLTIYNQNFALVKEERDMTLERGINYISVQDVAAMIEPSSVAFKSLTDPDSVVVREQNYQYDLIGGLTILNKSVGKTVKIRKFLDGSIREDEGVLLSTPDNGLVLQTSTGIILNPGGEIEVMELPEGLVSRPTLMWKLEADRPGAHRTRISYLANKITWSADYVAVVDALDKQIDLTGWVTLDNKSGATYENASLNLIAGDVHRVREDRAVRLLGDAGAVDLRAEEPQFAERAFFEYHLYTLQGKTTVKDKETKQLTLLTASNIPAKKVYVYDGARNGKKVNVLMEIVNSKESKLGIPLPKGKVRVYKAEADANQHFIGEDLIDHTPRDEKLRLYLGDAFDIVGERKQTNFRRITDHETEASYEISLRNHKDTPVTVVVVEHTSGEWKITENSHKYFKKDANTFEFPVQVPMDGEVKVTYTIRTKW